MVKNLNRFSVNTRNKNIGVIGIQIFFVCYYYCLNWKEMLRCRTKTLKMVSKMPSVRWLWSRSSVYYWNKFGRGTSVHDLESLPNERVSELSYDMLLNVMLCQLAVLNHTRIFLAYKVPHHLQEQGTLWKNGLYCHFSPPRSSGKILEIL